MFALHELIFNFSPTLLIVLTILFFVLGAYIVIGTLSTDNMLPMMSINGGKPQFYDARKIREGYTSLQTFSSNFLMAKLLLLSFGLLFLLFSISPYVKRDDEVKIKETITHKHTQKDTVMFPNDSRVYTCSSVKINEVDAGVFKTLVIPYRSGKSEQGGYEKADATLSYTENRKPSKIRKWYGEQDTSEYVNHIYTCSL